jgi:hypothetical protein
MQIGEIALESNLVVLPRHPIHAWCRLTLERVERHRKCFDVDVMKERGEFFLLPLPCSLPHAAQRL